MINQLGKVKLRQKLGKPGWARSFGAYPLPKRWPLCSAVGSLQKSGFSHRSCSALPHPPEPQPLPEPCTVVLGLALGCPAMCSPCRSPGIEKGTVSQNRSLTNRSKNRSETIGLKITQKKAGLDSRLGFIWLNLHTSACNLCFLLASLELSDAVS